MKVPSNRSLAVATTAYAYQSVFQQSSHSKQSSGQHLL